MNGLIVVYKEKGWTSHDVVAKLRGILGTRKIGHAGTLDPQAEGVLPIGVGQGTRILEYVGNSHKTYEGEMVFGLKSDTEDLQGLLEEQPYDQGLLKEALISRVFEELHGTTLSQLPPMYSSVKVQGKKLYEYARAGQIAERQSRPVELFSLRPHFPVYQKEGRTCLKFTAKVSKGTYIRTLCVEIGERLGVPAVMGDLVRTEVGSFTLQDAYTLEQLAQRMEGKDIGFLRTLRSGISGQMDELLLEDADYERIRLGQKIPTPKNCSEEGLLAGIWHEELVCILRNDGGVLRIIKNVGA